MSLIERENDPLNPNPDPIGNDPMSSIRTPVPQTMPDLSGQDSAVTADEAIARAKENKQKKERAALLPAFNSPQNFGMAMSNRSFAEKAQRAYWAKEYSGVEHDVVASALAWGLDPKTVSPDFVKATKLMSLDKDKLFWIQTNQPYLYDRIVSDPIGFGASAMRDPATYSSLYATFEEKAANPGWVERLGNAMVGGGYQAAEASSALLLSMTGTDDEFNKYVDEVADRQRARQQLMPSTEGYEGGFIGKSVLYAGEQLANLAVGAAGNALAGLAVGAEAGPVGSIAGSLVGIFATTFTLEAGSAMLEMAQMRDENGQRLKRDDIFWAAIGTGIINGALEAVGEKATLGLFKAGPGFAQKIAQGALKGKALQIAAKDAGFLGELKNIGFKYTENILVNEGQELAQEVSNIEAEAYLRDKMTGSIGDKGVTYKFKEPTADENLARLKDIFWATLGSSMVFGTAGAITTGGPALLKGASTDIQRRALAKQGASMQAAAKTLEASQSNAEVIAAVAEAAKDVVASGGEVAANGAAKMVTDVMAAPESKVKLHDEGVKVAPEKVLEVLDSGSSNAMALEGAFPGIRKAAEDSLQNDGEDLVLAPGKVILAFAKSESLVETLGQHLRWVYGSFSVEEQKLYGKDLMAAAAISEQKSKSGEDFDSLVSAYEKRFADVQKTAETSDLGEGQAKQGQRSKKLLQKQNAVVAATIAGKVSQAWKDVAAANAQVDKTTLSPEDLKKVQEAEARAALPLDKVIYVQPGAILTREAQSNAMGEAQRFRVGVPLNPQTEQDGKENFQAEGVRSGEEQLNVQRDARGVASVRDAAAALEARTREKFPPIEWPDKTAIREPKKAPSERARPETKEKYKQHLKELKKQNAEVEKFIESIAGHLTDEAAFELDLAKTGVDTGADWYTIRWQKAVDVLAEKGNMPELKDPQQRIVFTAIIAIMSNGESVQNNTSAAIKVYKEYVKTGKIPRVHTQREAVSTGLGRLEELIEKMGVEKMSEYLLQEMTSGEAQELVEKNGGNPSGGYLKEERVPLSTAEFGPKIGAFFSNLMGSSGALTMDMWWMRTVNRYLGALIPSLTTEKINEFRAVAAYRGKVGLPKSWTKQQVIDHAFEVSRNVMKKYRAHQKAGGTSKTFDWTQDGNKQAEKIIEAIKGINEVPPAAGKRSLMLAAARRAVKNLEDKGYKNGLGKPVTLADLQAIVWYFEKRVYAKITGKDTGDVDYNDIAELFVEGKLKDKSGVALEGEEMPEYEGPGVDEFPGPDGEFFPEEVRSITAEAMPSTKFNDVLGALPREKRVQFTQDAFDLVKDMAAKLGLPKVTSYLVNGEYRNVVSPTMRVDVNGTPEMANLVASVIRLVMKQEAVPWFRVTPDGTGDTHSEVISLEEDVTVEQLEAFTRAMNEGLSDDDAIGFTQFDPTTIVVSHYGDPAMLGEFKDRVDAAQKAVFPNASREAAKSEGNYGNVSDWSEGARAESEDAVLAEIKGLAAGFQRDIGEAGEGWIRDAARAYEELVQRYSAEVTNPAPDTRGRAGTPGAVGVASSSPAVPGNRIAAAPDTFQGIEEDTDTRSRAFYDNAIKQVEGMNLPSAPGSTWLKIIGETAEMMFLDRMSGIKEYFASKPKMTKQEVLDFIAENTIQTRTIRGGDWHKMGNEVFRMIRFGEELRRDRVPKWASEGIRTKVLETNELIEHEKEYFRRTAVLTDAVTGEVVENMSEAEIDEAAQNSIEEQLDDSLSRAITKSEFSLGVSGQTAIILSTYWGVFEFSQTGNQTPVVVERYTDEDEATASIIDKMKKSGTLEPTAFSREQDYNLPGGERPQERLVVWKNAPATTGYAGKEQHWGDIKNILGWYRSWWRTIGGKKIKALEELQSDWLQSVVGKDRFGRKRDFAGPEVDKEIAELTEEMAKLEADRGALDRQLKAFASYKDANTDKHLEHLPEAAKKMRKTIEDAKPGEPYAHHKPRVWGYQRNQDGTRSTVYSGVVGNGKTVLYTNIETPYTYGPRNYLVVEPVREEGEADKAFALRKAIAMHVFNGLEDGRTLLLQMNSRTDEGARDRALTSIAYSVAKKELEDDRYKAAEEYSSRKARRGDLQTRPQWAPFRNTWHEMLMRRALLDAVEEGSPALAWTPGSVHVERWDQSRHFAEIGWMLQPDGKFTLTATPKESDQPVVQEDLAEDKLADYIGAEMAGKIAEGAKTEKSGSFRGDSLKMSNAFSLKLYDEKMVQYANKLGKKYGVRVEEQTDDLGQKWHVLPIPDRMRQTVKEESMPQWQPDSGQEGAQTQPKPAQGPSRARGWHNRKTHAIHLTAAANHATFLHEVAHWYLEELVQLADAAGPDSKHAKELQAIFAWLGVESYEAMESKDHEHFADGFLVYMATGRAPTQQLRGVFARFRQWILNLYHTGELDTLKDEFFKDGDLPLEIRLMYSRMLATDDEIAAAEGKMDISPLFASAEEAGMTDEQYAEYLAGSGRAIADRTRERMDARTFRGLSKLNSDEYKRRLNELVEKNIERIKATKTYRLLQMFRNPNDQKTWHETPSPMNRAMVEDILKKMPHGKELIKALPSYLVSEDGMDPEHFARANGYETGAQMVLELINMSSDRYIRSQAVKQAQSVLASDIQKEMNEMGGDEALMNERLENMLIAEIEAVEKLLSDKAGRSKRAIDFYKRRARAIVSEDTVGNQRPDKFLNEAYRQARLAGSAKKAGDMEAFAEARRRQLLNHYLYKESLALQREAGKLQKKAVALAKKGKNMKVQYGDQISNIATRFQFTVGKKKGAISLKEFLDAQAAQRDKEDEPGSVLTELAVIEDDNVMPPVYWKTLTIDQLQQVVDAMSHIEALYKLNETIYAYNERVRIENVNTELLEAAATNAPKAKLRTPENMKKEWKHAKSFRKFFWSFRKMSNYFRVLDGGSETGPFFKYFMQMIARSENHFNEMMQSHAQKLADLLAPMKGRLNEQVAIPNSKHSISRETLFMLALNMGNEINRSRVYEYLRPYGREKVDLLPGVTAENVEMLVKNLLSLSEWKTIQSIWDMYEGMRPAMEQLELRTKGVRMSLVEASPIEVGGVTFRGGYFPIAYDPRLKAITGQRNANKSVEEEKKSAGIHSMMKTKQGQFKARTGSGGQRLWLSLDVVQSTMADHIHDLAFRESVDSVRTLLRNNNIGDMLLEQIGPDALNAINQWAGGITKPSASVNAAARSDGWLAPARRGMSLQAMFGRLTTAVQQPLGLLQSAQVIGHGWTAVGFQQFLDGDQRKIIKELSSFMRTRLNTQERNMHEAIERARTENTWNSFIEKIAYWPMQRTQFITDQITWLGAYSKYVNSNDQTEVTNAVELADRAVRDSQGSSNKSAMSLFEADDAEWKRIFTMFQTFFYSTANIALEKYELARGAGTAWDVMSDPRKVAELGLRYIGMFVLPAVLGNLLTNRWPEDDDDDDKTDGMEILKWGLDSTFGYTVAAIPFGRDIYGGIRHRRYAPAGSPVEPVAKAAVAAWRMAQAPFSEEMDVRMKDVLALTKGVGVLSPYANIEVPLGGQTAVAFQAIADMYSHGDEVGPWSLVWQTEAQRDLRRKGE